MLNWEYVRYVGYGKFLWRSLLRHTCRRLLRIDNHIRLPNGILMLLPWNSSFASEVFVTHCDVDWGSEALLLRHLEKEKSFLDVGANIGYYSLLASPYVKSVFAFEPDPRNLPALERNASRVSNVTVVREAVSSRGGEVCFNVGGDPSVSHIVVNGMEDSNTILVQCTTLDKFVTRSSALKVTAIKIDVEGFDLDVLLGAEALLQREQPLILTEFTRQEGRANEQKRLLEYLERLRYSLFAFVRPLSPFVPRPTGLIRLDRGNLDAFRWKMLFLVPERLQAQFLTLTQQPANTLGVNQR